MEETIMFYIILFLYTAIVILFKYNRYLRHKKKAIKRLTESFNNLKDTWKKFKGQMFK
jgi:hypothetical protein